MGLQSIRKMVLGPDVAAVDLSFSPCVCVAFEKLASLLFREYERASKWSSEHERDGCDEDSDREQANALEAFFQT